MGTLAFAAHCLYVLSLSDSLSPPPRYSVWEQSEVEVTESWDRSEGREVGNWVPAGLDFSLCPQGLQLAPLSSCSFPIPLENVAELENTGKGSYF